MSARTERTRDAVLAGIEEDDRLQRKERRLKERRRVINAAKAKLESHRGRVPAAEFADQESLLRSEVATWNADLSELKADVAETEARFTMERIMREFMPEMRGAPNLRTTPTLQDLDRRSNRRLLGLSSRFEGSPLHLGAPTDIATIPTHRPRTLADLEELDLSRAPFRAQPRGPDISPLPRGPATPQGISVFDEATGPQRRPPQPGQAFTGLDVLRAFDEGKSDSP